MGNENISVLALFDHVALWLLILAIQAKIAIGLAASRKPHPWPNKFIHRRIIRYRFSLCLGLVAWNLTWSMNFDERPRRRGGADFSWGQCSLRPTSWEHCSRGVAVRIEWSFCLIYCNIDSQCFSIDRTTLPQLPITVGEESCQWLQSNFNGWL